MSVIPVIDVKDGIVVHAVGGQRDRYLPLRSQIVDSVEPLAVAEAMLKAVGADELYVADLNGIQSDGRPSEAVLKLLDQCSAKVWLDCGVRNFDERIDSLKNRSNVNLILASESFASFDVVERYRKLWDWVRLAVSIDLLNGLLLRPPDCDGVDINEFIRKAVKNAIYAFFIIDIGNVGSMNSAGNSLYMSLAEDIQIAIDQTSQPDFRYIVGGGFRNWDDVDAFDQHFIDCLASTAIHNRSLVPPPPPEVNPWAFVNDNN